MGGTWQKLVGTGGKRPIQVYAVPKQQADAAAVAHPILLSYIDVMIQGFLRKFGAAGAANFFCDDAWLGRADF